LYENDLSVEQLIPLAAYVITETASQDGKVGGRVQMATITPDAGCIELRQEEVDGIVAKNQAVNKSLRELFRK
jgi:20S proteasome alpha/beta subunit